MIYKMNDCCITLNGKWDDRSVNVLTTNSLPIANVNLVITREPLAKTSALASQVEHARTEFSKNLPSVKFISDTPGEKQQKEAHFFEMTWIDKGMPMHQMITMIHVDDTVITIGATAPGMMDDVTRVELMNIVRSFKLNKV